MNTLENKSKFFALYWGNKLCTIQNLAMIKMILYLLIGVLLQLMKMIIS